MHKEITQPNIETISISKVSGGNFQHFKGHFKLKLVTVDFDNLPIPSNVSIPAFEWIEKQTEPAHNDEYMNWLQTYIPLSNRDWYDVGNNKHLLDYQNPRLPFKIYGGTDVVVVKKGEKGVDFNTIQEDTFAVLELKKKIERKHIFKVIVEMFVADLLASDDKKVFGILSNLIDEWYILWFEDMKIKSWKASSRDIAVEVISRLLRDSSGVDMEGTSIIIPCQA